MFFKVLWRFADKRNVLQGVEALPIVAYCWKLRHSLFLQFQHFSKLVLVKTRLTNGHVLDILGVYFDRIKSVSKKRHNPAIYVIYLIQPISHFPFICKFLYILFALWILIKVKTNVYLCKFQLWFWRYKIITVPFSVIFLNWHVCS